MVSTQLVAERRKIFSVRLHPEEHALIVSVAEHLGMPVAVLIRSLVMQKARELGLPVPKIPRPSAAVAPAKKRKR